MSKSITLIITLIFSFACGKSEKKELDLKYKSTLEQQIKEQRIKDSITFEEAKKYYLQQDWYSAYHTFKRIKQTEFFKLQSEEYILKINNRPWQEAYGYISASANGKFSNSATKDSPLWVELKFNKDGYTYLYMYEYAISKPENKSAEKPMYDFSIYVSGYKSDYLCYEINPNDSYLVSDATHSEGIRLSGNLSSKVRDILTKSSNDVYFSITMGSSSTYKFNVSPIGFSKAYKSLK